MKMTLNRKLTLQILSEGSDEPPYSASSVVSDFEMALELKWHGFEKLKTAPNKQQVHRTLRELWADGLIVGTRVKCDWNDRCLPYWEVRYQLSCQVERNHIASLCSDIHRKVKKAKHGVNMFGGVFDMGLPACEISELTRDVKKMLQKTHTDKSEGMEYQFQQMIECRDLIKSGIPAPQPTHTIGENQFDQAPARLK